MRILYLFIFLCAVLSNNAQTKILPKEKKMKKDYSVSFRGKVESLHVKNNKSSIMLSVNLKMKLLNDGLKPVIFLATKPPDLRGVALTKDPSEVSYSKFLAWDYYGESVDTSQEWTDLSKTLNQSSPPLNKVKVLMPNESWVFEGVSSIALPKEASKNYSSRKKETWENIKNLPAVWLRVNSQVWSLNLEPKSNDRTDLPFGNKLQKRWKDIGLLWLDYIQSEPIPLDLKETTLN